MDNFTPSAIHWHQQSNCLELEFAQQTFELGAELLRVHSPSAEVQGHGKPQLVRQKQDVRIAALEPVGRYALKISFDDGHDSGIYSWQWLYMLGRDQHSLMQQYQQKCAELASQEAEQQQRIIPIRQL